MRTARRKKAPLAPQRNRSMPTTTVVPTWLTAQDRLRATGAAFRVTSGSSGSNEPLTQLLTQITNSIKDLATKHDSSDSMLPMTMMMLMLGGGGGGGAPAAPPPPPP